jgi:ubiquinone/menaquinone biosynthesis C-methylase UbiE
VVLDRLPGPLRRLLYAGGSREDRLRDPDAVISALDLRPGMVVADLGPGYGHFSLRMARAVEPDGAVYAIDASQGTLDELMAAAGERGITNLRPVKVGRDRLEIPQLVDLLFVSATYHHLPQPARYFADARRHLRPGARLVILESRASGLLAGLLNRHGSPPDRLRHELADAGYRLLATHDLVVGHLFAEFEVVTGPQTDEQAASVPS